MARTREAYETMGTNDAIAVHGGATWASLGRTMSKDAKTWQARAYWAAYEEREAFLTLAHDSKPRAKPTSAFKTPSCPTSPPFNTAGWPKAATHHISLLIGDLNQEKAPGRRRRLQKAIDRLRKRHGGEQKLDFVVSTQPHPDGDGTVRMLLSGQ